MLWPDIRHFDESIEEYLEAIYRLEREGPGVTTSGLAADLGRRSGIRFGDAEEARTRRLPRIRARGEAKLTERGLRSASASCGGIAWRSASSRTCSACRGTKCTKKRAASNTRSPRASKNASSRLLERSRNSVRTGIRFRRPILATRSASACKLAESKRAAKRAVVDVTEEVPGDLALSRSNRACAPAPTSTRYRAGAARRSANGRGRERPPRDFARTRTKLIVAEPA